MHYLDKGWFAKGSVTKLRTEVVDAAADLAGMLVRAGVPAHRLIRIAVKLRSMVVMADPSMRGAGSRGLKNRDQVLAQISYYSEDCPELQGFLADCMDQVSKPEEMNACYLHLLHVSRMMQLLSHAVGSLAVPPIGVHARVQTKKEKVTTGTKTKSKKTTKSKPGPSTKKKTGKKAKGLRKAKQSSTTTKAKTPKKSARKAVRRS